MSSQRVLAQGHLQAGEKHKIVTHFPTSSRKDTIAFLLAAKLPFKSRVGSPRIASCCGPCSGWLYKNTAVGWVQGEQVIHSRRVRCPRWGGVGSGNGGVGE